MTYMECRKLSRFDAMLLCFCASLLIVGCNSSPHVENASSADLGDTAAAPQHGQDKSASANAAPAYPLDPLTASEIQETLKILKESGKVTDASRFASISLVEPPKEWVLKFKTGDQLNRQSFSVIYELSTNKTFEATVDLSKKSLTRYEQAAGQALVPEDVTIVRKVVRADKNWQNAMRKRGIEHFDDVYIAAWASAYLPENAANRKRMLKAFFYYRGTGDNAFFRPIEGVLADVDLAGKKIVKLSDTGVVPIAPVKQVSIPSEFIAKSRVQTNTNSKATTNVPGLQIDGHEIHWKNWRFRYSVTPRDGLVLYTVSYDDHGKIRPIMYRGSVSELCVPYADPSAGWSFRDAFDVGQFGLGSSTSSLEALTDAPENSIFFDAVMANQLGEPVVHPHALALYEKDGGILWRHFDRPNNRQLSVRGKDLVLSFITTLSNYDYCFNWIFHEDGSLEMETGMTGVMLAKGVEDADAHARADTGALEHAHAHKVEKTIEAVHHQHFFCFRLDMDVDSANNNSLVETNGVSVPDKAKNPYGNAFCVSETKLRHEHDAVRLLNMATTRRWKVVNENQKNELGQQTGYMLIPGENSVPYSMESSYVRQRAGFINAHVWATAYDPRQMYAAGEYPFDSTASKGLPDWIKANRPIEKSDIVLWYNMGITHTPRPEEWPIMPVHRSGFKLIPNCFFGKNPALTFKSPKP